MNKAKHITNDHSCVKCHEAQEAWAERGYDDIENLICDECDKVRRKGENMKGTLKHFYSFIF